MKARGDIVAVGLLTQEDIRRLGNSFSRLFPLPREGAFDDLIKAIDEADKGRHMQDQPRLL